jgi:predicted DNA-binding protein (MmcQ/YjbR family)
MDAERVRAFVLALPHVEETHQWGDNIVFWVGDKAIGGKMFALLSLEPGGWPSGVMLSLSAGAERFNEFLENENIIPAPYFARIHWIGLQRWNALPARELETALAAAHAMTYAKLPKRVKDVLALPAATRKKLIAERRKELAKEKKSKAAKAAG